MATPSPLSARDQTFLRRAIALSAQARREGHHPFGALVVSAAGEVVAEGINGARLPGGDPTRHAELVAVSRAARQLPPDALAACTLYTSAEPCAMCAGATYWCGVGRVVYALSEARLLTLTGRHPENPTLDLPCRDVFIRGQRVVEVVGPALEDEAAAVHVGFWA
ncbi:nucleoside deaminase [Deinococcus rufus]|uniref:Nucleoside deaminase n=1 Tax=Deinococcus rufus TaxID=2136097 RepID=A0ABV7ZDR9_9DEIO